MVIALLYNLPPIRRRLSLTKWVGASLLVCGALVADLSQNKSRDVDGELNSGGTYGLILVLIGLVLASSGAVSTEYAFKTTAEDLSYPAQACIMYSYGAVLNFAAFFVWPILD